MQKILNAVEMRRDDENTIQRDGIPSQKLMECAARAALTILKTRFDTAHVLFLCGSGNNGGDGFAMARFFAADGGKATVVYLGKKDPRGLPDVDAMSAECARQYTLLPKTVTLADTLCLTGITTVVDAIFGIGLTRPIEGKIKETIDMLNQAHLPVLAVDIPSGINADNGAVMGVAISATETVAIAARKYGHVLYPGAQFCGKVTVANIGIRTGEAKGYLLERDDLSLLPPRPSRSHKGTFGRVLVVGGSPNMSGAAYLAAKAAYRTGAGLVEICCPTENRLAHQISLPEAILTAYTAQDAKERFTSRLPAASAVAIGMGLSQSETAKTLVATALTECQIPLIVDADALNLIAADPTLLALLYHRTTPTVLTPHIAEMARLTGKAIPLISGDMPHAATALSLACGATVVLKDARTVIADGDTIYINTFGNSGMATGGSGDVLAGIIASFAAQGADAVTAAKIGVLTHALAGDVAKEHTGEHGLMASDLIEGICRILS